MNHFFCTHSKYQSQQNCFQKDSRTQFFIKFIYFLK